MEPRWFNHYKSLMPPNSSSTAGSSVCLRSIAPLLPAVGTEPRLSRCLSLLFLFLSPDVILPCVFLLVFLIPTQAQLQTYVVRARATWLALSTQLPACSRRGVRVTSLLVKMSGRHQERRALERRDSRRQRLDGIHCVLGGKTYFWAK